jgi:hypothetical protein
MDMSEGGDYSRKEPSKEKISRTGLGPGGGLPEGLDLSWKGTNLSP